MPQQSARAVSAPSVSNLVVGTVYGTALLQGLAMVSFPASSTVLTGTLGLSSAQYGAIFLPQVALAIVGSIGGGTLAQKWGLKTLLALALMANAASQVLLAATMWVAPALIYPAVLLGTASMGLGFGISGAPLNSYPPLFFPEKSDTAVVALHSILGAGLALDPVLVAPFVARDAWVGFPLLLAALCALILLATALLPLPEDETADKATSSPRPVRTGLFWMFVVAAVAYAFAEGTFSNWAVIYLHEARGVPEATAGIALFALAGLACSSFFPLAVTLISRAFPDHVAWASSMMIAALMVGVGGGSFIFGPLQSAFSVETIYRLSTLYPVLALIAALIVVRSEPCKQTIHDLWTGSRCQ
jgi:MFS family permease